MNFLLLLFAPPPPIFRGEGGTDAKHKDGHFKLDTQFMATPFTKKEVVELKPDNQKEKRKTF
jgi:hypothetical protein